ncbi:hypothetical protein ONS96_006977 [Cadophora gregata f. sp. sojae]|nr:hypothetical protein ONS96_006977 [Cadophora gregata f. sp. sojae]
MVCPEAYKTVAMSVLDKSSTRVGCCPSGYNFVDWASAPNPRQCNSPLPAQIVTYIQTVSSGTWTTTSTSISEPSSVWGVQINGILFAKPAATSTNVVTSKAAQSNTEVSVPTSHHSGLARGAKVGIGIGSVLALVFLCAMLVMGILFWNRKRKLTTSQSQVAIEPQYSEEDQKSFPNVRNEEIPDDQVKSTRHVGMG